MDGEGCAFIESTSPPSSAIHIISFSRSAKLRKLLHSQIGLKMSFHPLPLAALCAVLHFSIVFAQGSAQSGENGGGNGAPSIDPNASAPTSAPASQNAAGASGGSNDIGGLSGGTIAAIIVVAIVVVLGAGK